jgi:small basic protein|tara:strand:- start:724 stop:849 length:126 start_codon:yes stop_codon:yes gene_type:complete
MDKKGQLFDFMSFVKGLFIGIIIGAVLIYMGAKGSLPIPVC